MPSRILVLVGPKGSGKTTIGRILERQPGVHFLEVETIAKRVLAEAGGVIDEHYARRAFDAIRAEIDVIDDHFPLVVLETTGASDETRNFLAALSERHELHLARVHAPVAVCAERIATRDPSRQVDVPHELVRRMHEKTLALELPWELEVNNGAGLTESEILSLFEPFTRQPREAT